MNGIDWPKVATWVVTIAACLALWWGVAEMVTS